MRKIERETGIPAGETALLGHCRTMSSAHGDGNAGTVEPQDIADALSLDKSTQVERWIPMQAGLIREL